MQQLDMSVNVLATSHSIWQADRRTHQDDSGAIRMESMESLLTTADVAKVLQKPVRTLGQWRYQNVGPRFIRVGRDV
ncbi:MAG TPA: hypothetical protein VFR11_01005, partial [Micromonosporaceae bacterium]|nr:hypothetical protein [Micromonosporaceae bacterium]